MSYSNFKMKRKSCIHCKMAHRQYLDKTYTCEVCGVEFVGNNKVRHVTCSVACSRVRISNRHSTYRRSSVEKTVRQLATAAASRAKRRGMECDIDQHYLLELLEQQGGLCARTGQELCASRKDGTGLRGAHQNTVSIDRIESNKGYVKGNIELVSYHYNIAKSKYTTEEFEDLCRMVLTKAGFSVSGSRAVVHE